ncbi:unnamed protein product [Clonostachys rhizophaga]|uniref:Uncharacterized protein n=1 Tax=Clonostachys rhizophaga TaxID=160324 RepID=A0A9N9VV30_9HYPO|nr:unnamed protein product [Clonostachys rhizophaga]
MYSGSSQSGVYGTVAATFLYLGSYSFGLTPLTNIYPPEVLSNDLRAIVMGCSQSSPKLVVIFVTMAFPLMFKLLWWKTYIINASWNIAFFVFVYSFWVETRGKTLEEIDVLFDGVKHSDTPDLNTVDAGEKAIETMVERVQSEGSILRR